MNDYINGAKRDDAIYYIMDNYGHSPEYLWAKYPSYCIFRCPENQKWYAIVMTIKKEQLGINEKGNIDILDIKAEPLEIERLIKDKKALPAYHMSKKSWITFLLDGSVNKNEIFNMIDKSYEIVKNNKK